LLLANEEEEEKALASLADKYSLASGGLEVDTAALRLVEDGASPAERELEGLEGGVTIP
jgi:hypothetical protein